MANTSDKLPDRIRSLIERKLTALQRELHEARAAYMVPVFTELRRRIDATIITDNVVETYLLAPQAVFEKQGAYALSETRRWPSEVWNTIAAVLAATGTNTCDESALNSIVDEFTWPMSGPPFTLTWIDRTETRDLVMRTAAQYGIDRQDLLAQFEDRIGLRVLATGDAIENAARHAREAVALSIGEYLLGVAARARVSAAQVAVTTAAPSVPVPEVATAADDILAVFKAMERFTADEVTIAFVGDRPDEGFGAHGILEISARGERRRVPEADIGLVNRNTGHRNKQGVMLTSLTITGTIPDSPTNVKTVSRLRDLLRTHLGFADDPFERRTAQGWKPRFHVIDRRGDADVRAEKTGRRRTISLESYREVADVDDRDDVEYGPDDAEIWLEENDPDA